jgi:hypothetical protein
MLGEALYWSTYAVVALLFGGGSVPLPEEQAARRDGTLTASLVLDRTRGPTRTRQVDLESRVLVRIGRRAALVRGTAWVQPDAVVWAPDKRWREIGAKGSSLPIAGLRDVSITRLGMRRTGVVVRGGDDGETWLLFHARYTEVTDAFERQPKTRSPEETTDP